MKIDKVWVRRRWMDGRTGHTNYLMFSLTILNFVLIVYRFLIEKEPGLNQIFSNLIIFSFIVMIFYTPISIIVGNWHKRKQLSIENNIKHFENPMQAYMFRTILDYKLGKVSQKELITLREFLLKIEKNKKDEDD